MKAFGIVESVRGEGAVVTVKRDTACGDSCATCPSKCHQRNNKIIAKNPLGAKAGDKVTIEMKSSTVLKSAFLVYILPLIMLFAGYYGVDYLGYEERVSVLCGLILFSLTFLVLHIWDKHHKERFSTTIVEIEEEND